MTTSATVQMFLFIHLGIILVVTAYYTASAALAPGMAARSRVRFGEHPWRMFIYGLVVSVPWIVIALVGMNAGAGAVKFLGGGILALWLLAALVGGAGVAQHIGAGNKGDAAGEGGGGDWKVTARGGLLMTLTWVLPVVGWFGMLPLTLIVGVGCVVKDLLTKKVVVDERVGEGLID